MNDSSTRSLLKALLRKNPVLGATVLVILLGLSYLRYSREAPTGPSSSPLPTGFVQVSETVDGDTIKVIENGQVHTVRLLGIDTPESVDPRTPVECFGKEASEYTDQLLAGKAVRLEADPTQGETDRFGRRLAFIFLEDGTNVSQRLVEEGYATEYTYAGRPHKYQLEFRAAQAAASEAGKGLWSAATCKGVR